MGKLKVGVVGAGKRFESMYFPVLQSLENVEIVGFVTKSGKVRENFGNHPVFNKVSDLVEKTSPDFLEVFSSKDAGASSASAIAGASGFSSRNLSRPSTKPISLLSSIVAAPPPPESSSEARITEYSGLINLLLIS